MCDECGNEWPDPALSRPLAREPGTASVPTPEATWSEIWHFAHLVDGYRTHGDALGDMANASVSHFEREHEIDPLLPLSDLRACLFFEARRYRHFGHDPDSDDTPYLRALVTAIRDLTADGSRPA